MRSSARCGISLGPTRVTHLRRRWHYSGNDGKSPHIAFSSPRTSLATKKKSFGSSSSVESVPHAAPKAFLVGTLAGVLGSLAGMGGGFVMIPIMTSSLLRLSQHAAHGTSLFAVAATGVSGAIGYGIGDVVELDTAAALAACGAVTARLGAATTSTMGPRSLKTALGIFMLCVAPLVPGKAYIAAMHHDASEPVHKHHEEMGRARRLIPAGCIGLGSGFLAGLFGVGGGAIVVPALTVATDMTHYQALGTSLCAMTVPAVVGTWTHFQAGNVAMRVAPALALGAGLGAYFGGKFGLNISEMKLKLGFSGLMIVLGTKTLLTR